LGAAALGRLKVHLQIGLDLRYFFLTAMGYSKVTLIVGLRRFVPTGRANVRAGAGDGQ
jgi:hypothetical protein